MSETKSRDAATAERIQNNTPTEYYKGFKILGPYQTGTYDRIEDRKRKYYGAKLVFSYDVLDLESAGRGGGNHRARSRNFNTALAQEPRLAGFTVGASIEWFRGLMLGASALLTDEENKLKSLESYRIYVGFFKGAAKPSEIMDEAALRSRIEAVKVPHPTEVTLKIIHDELDGALEDMERGSRVHYAKLLAAKLAKKADEKARETTRFEQRLAGLVAELASEQMIQLVKLRAEIAGQDQVTIAVAMTDGTTGKKVLDERTIKAALEHAHEGLPPADPGFHGFDTSERLKITDADVK